MSRKNAFPSLTAAVACAQLMTSQAVIYSGFQSTPAPLQGTIPFARAFDEVANERSALDKELERREQQRAIMPRNTVPPGGSEYATMLNENSQPVLESKFLGSTATSNGSLDDLFHDLLRKSEHKYDHVSLQSQHTTSRRGHVQKDQAQEPYTEAFEYHLSRNATVALWSPHILARPPFLAHYVSECNVVKAFEDHHYPHVDVSYADVVVFNLGQVEDLIALGKQYLPAVKPKGQLWVAGCWEPRVYAQVGAKGDCSLLNDRLTMSVMDAVASYDADSDFPAFFTPPSFEQMQRPAPDFKANFFKLNSGTHPAIASTVTSDCRVGRRNNWFKEVKDAFFKRGHPDAILAYGKCNRTVEERSCEGDSDDVRRDEGPSSIAEVWIRAANRCMAQPFQLISENTQAPWYITEKVWNALATGAIPVYDGPPEVKKLVPPGSVLFADDFASTADLVDAMLSFTEEGYARARAWKKLPATRWGGWAEGRRLSRATLVPRLCEAASKRPKVQPLAVEDAGLKQLDTQVPLRPSQAWLEIEGHHNGQKKDKTSSTSRV